MGAVLVVEEDTHRRRVEVVELPVPGRPAERQERASNEQQSEGDQEEKDGHFQALGTAR